MIVLFRHCRKKCGAIRVVVALRHWGFMRFLFPLISEKEKRYNIKCDGHFLYFPNNIYYIENEKFSPLQ